MLDLDPDPDQFADDKPNFMESMFCAFIWKLGPGPGSVRYQSKRKDQDLPQSDKQDPGDADPKHWF